MQPSSRLPVAIYSDYCDQGANPRHWAHLAAEAGFTHLHWGHEYASEKPHSDAELDAIGEWLREEGLGVVDIHASAGGGFQWTSPEESLRLPALELVRDALRMHLCWQASGAVVAHPAYLDNRELQGASAESYRLEQERRFDAMRRSLDELLPDFEAARCVLALENLPGDTGEMLDRVFALYPSPWLGYCFDSGHANMRTPADGFAIARRHARRMAAVHLHDNDGVSDLHTPPFFGSIDWPGTMAIIRNSAYRDIPSFEFSLRNTPYHSQGTRDFRLPEETIRSFLKDAFQRCQRVAEMA